MKSMLILFFCLLSTCFCNAKIVLTNSKFVVTNLNGTNGYVIMDSNKPYRCGAHISFLSHLTNDYIVTIGGSNKTIIREKITDKILNLNNRNGTNAFSIDPNIYEIFSDKLGNWVSGSWLLGISAMVDSFENEPLHVLEYNSNPTLPTISLTSDIWSVSCRLFITNEPPNYNYPAIMAGNFLKSGYTMGYKPETGKVVFVTQPNFTDDVRYITLNVSNSVVFSGDGTPGNSLSAVGDVNGDNFDDILVGNKNCDYCWLLFGGCQWISNEISLANLGTNGIQINSMFEFNPPHDTAPIVGNCIANVGDMNGDGINDIAYSDWGWIGNLPWDFPIYDSAVIIAYGATNNQINYHNGFIIRGTVSWDDPFLNYSFNKISGNGDVNGDGHNDLLIMTENEFKILVYYGGPFIRQTIYVTNGVNGINGFELDQLYIPPVEPQTPWYNADISGNVNGDRFNDILFSAGSASRPTNYAYLVYGGQSPSAPPALRTPLWINVGESNSLTFELTDVPTNIIWTGCKKGDDFTFCYTNGVRCPAWDIPMGKLWFTNSYTITSTDEFLTVSYTSTNALGPAAGFTTLTIEPIPEPITTGIVFLTTALIGKAILNK